MTIDNSNYLIKILEFKKNTQAFLDLVKNLISLKSRNDLIKNLFGKLTSYFHIQLYFSRYGM